MKKFIILFIILIIPKNYSLADDVYTGLKIPRFVSIKTNESNLRVGAGKQYPKILTYNSKNLPLEIIDEYDEWRKIIDFEGNIGWLHKRLLKGNRFAIINPPYEEPAQIYNKPEGQVIGKIGKKNILEIKTCLMNWCKIKYRENTGWINKLNLWGVYEKEIINVPFYQPMINLIWRINLNFFIQWLQR